MTKINIYKSASALYRLLIFAALAFYFIALLLFGKRENDAPDDNTLLYQLYMAIVFALLETYHQISESRLRQNIRHISIAMLAVVICFGLWQHYQTIATEGWNAHLLLTLSFEILQIFVLAGLIQKKL